MNEPPADSTIADGTPVDRPLPQAPAAPWDPAVLRLLDANANRAREALRVLEDYSRFVLDDRSTSGELKEIRHALRAALVDVLPEAILHRDTPGDVGTTNKTEAELSRAGIGDVVVASGKRAGEALRALEEYLKTTDPAASRQVEKLRYRTYEVERRLHPTIRPTACHFAHVRLYVLITESLCKRPWLEAAAEAIRGGADCIQLREKDLESGELLRRAKRLVELCRDTSVLCIVNDRPDVAVLAGADGVHVGQGDLPAADARKIVGSRRLVGVSTHDLGQAMRAVRDGADYIGVGPFFRSTTKPRDFTAGPDYARQVAERVRLPAVAIAGITAENVDHVLATGLTAVAVTSAVVGAADVAGAARQLKLRLNGGRNGGQAFLPVTRDPNRPSTVAAHERREPVALQITRRHLPHWQLKGATYYLTFRMAVGEMDQAARRVVLDHLKDGHGEYYTLIAAVVMPDHVHAILTPLREYTPDRILKGTKGATARLLNRRSQRTGRVWQDETWDRIIRDRDDLHEKLQYMLDNPVRKGLSADGWDWDGWYYNPAR